MTISAVFGGDIWVDFATNRGHGDFIRWTEQLPPDQFPLPVHLAEWGWAPVTELAQQLRAAMRLNPPKASLAKTLSGFIRALQSAPGDAASVMLTDGTTDQDQDGEWWVDGKPV